MGLLVIVPLTTPKGKMSAMRAIDENGESRFIKLDTEATREEWVQEKVKLGFAIIGECLVQVEVVHKMVITIVNDNFDVSASMRLNEKLLLIPLKGGEIQLIS